MNEFPPSSTILMSFPTNKLKNCSEVSLPINQEAVESTISSRSVVPLQSYDNVPCTKSVAACMVLREDDTTYCILLSVGVPLLRTQSTTAAAVVAQVSPQSSQVIKDD